MYNQCGEVDLLGGSGMECLRANVDALLTKIRRKYKEYGINEKPFVVVKADSGADALGPVTVRDAKDLADAYARARARAAAAAAPGAEPPAEAGALIIQEGVPTYERVNDAVAEPVVAMIDRYVVGGYYRVHAERGVDENLNAPGARYVPLAFAGSHHLPRPGDKPGASAPNRFYMYGVIGRLAMLAASYELEATDPDAEVYE
jgi:glutamate--cysteine ligase